MTYKLSVLIPARNEFYHEVDLLAHTIDNIIENSSEKTEVIAVLDGAWPLTPLKPHPRVTVVHHNKSIGQRAATNEAARISKAKYVMKLDAHCALGKGFDEILIADMQPHWTCVPLQFNLLAFEWKCKKCGKLRDQSPIPGTTKNPRCAECQSQYFKQVVVWKPRDGKEGRRNTPTHSWRFDSQLNFTYWGEYTSDERYCKKHNIPFRPEAQQEIHDTMSLLGACWMIERERYLDLNICDERFGSWGNQGTEVACKTWLSGGELKVNRKTWFAHMFRVGGLPFPYPGGGQKERAVARSKELWLQNAWPRQVYPLSWLIDKFSPLPDWDTPDNPVRALVNEAGIAFSRVKPFTGLAASVSLGGITKGEQVASDAMSSSGLPSTGAVTSEHVDFMGGQSQVERTATTPVITEMVKHQSISVAGGGQRPNQPSPNDSMKTNLGAVVTDTSIPEVVSIPNPVPATVIPKLDTGKDTNNLTSSQVVNGEVFSGNHDSNSQIIPRKTCLYYTCNSHDLTLELAARKNLRRATNGHELGCVALERTDFGDWSIVVNREKSGTTMHYQILEGLMRSTAKYVFLCESDVFYHKSHFDFIPPRDDTFYYNTNVWRVRYSDGHAVRTDGLQQVSGICADRKLLFNHYSKRIQMIEANGGEFDIKRMAYEPGTRGKFGDEKVANWESPYPNIDVTGHGKTLTQPKWSVDDFRNKKYSAGWTETDQQLPGWPKLSDGGLQHLLEELANGKSNDIKPAG